MTSYSQQRILELHNQMKMHPEDFSFRWGMDAAEIATICGVSRSSASHWLVGQTSRRIPGIAYQRILAVTDFLLANADRIQPLLERWRGIEESER
jgi:hypothetical protein